MRRALPLIAAALLLASTVVRPGQRAQARLPIPHRPPTLQTVARAISHQPLIALTAVQPVPPRIILGAKTSARLVALTFDLDMTPTMAAEVRSGSSWFNSDALSYLESTHVHATMFMTGMWAEMYPAIARQMAQDPDFEIGNHSFSHPAFHLPCYQLGTVSRAAQAAQIRMAQQAITWAAGVTPRYFRFPGGCYDRQAIDLVHAAGLTPVEWTVNSIDAFNPHPAQIASVVLSQVKPGSIVVMHLQGGLNAPSTAEALRVIVPTLEQRGYTFATVSELLAAGTALQPTDPREVAEAYQPPPNPVATVRPPPYPPPQAREGKPRGWCGWVKTRSGTWVWVCT